MNNKKYIKPSHRVKSDFADYFSTVEAEAISNVLSPNNQYLYRKIARWYSSKFSTKLTEVYGLPMYEVILNYFEHRYEQMEEKDLVESLKWRFTPELAQDEEDDILDWIREIEEEEEVKEQYEKKKLAKQKESSIDAPPKLDFKMDFNKDK